MSDLKTLLCPDCERPMQYESSPEIKWEFNLFGFTVQVWDFNTKEWMCIDCMSEQHEEPYRREYEAGHQDGYMEAHDKLAHRT